jgi:hypothetical protein
VCVCVCVFVSFDLIFHVSPFCVVLQPRVSVRVLSLRACQGWARRRLDSVSEVIYFCVCVFVSFDLSPFCVVLQPKASVRVLSPRACQGVPMTRPLV